MALFTRKKSTISDRISSLLQSAPCKIDSDEELDPTTAARVVSDEEADEAGETVETAPRSLLRQAASLAEDGDSKYSGKKTSRRALQESDESGASSAEESAEDESESDYDGGEEKPGESEEQSSEGSSEGLSGEESEELEDPSETRLSVGEKQGADSAGGDLRHFNRINLGEQQRKGLHVRNQLTIWEGLLEIRIQMQKCLLAANKMPQPDSVAELRALKDTGLNDSWSKTRSRASALLDSLLQLQSCLLKQYPETRGVLDEALTVKAAEGPAEDEEIASDTDEEVAPAGEGGADAEEPPPSKRLKLEQYSEVLETRHRQYTKYRNSVVQKWNDKTRLATGNSSTVAHSVLDQIQHVLADRQKLVKRTQQKRSKYEVFGKAPAAAAEEAAAEAEEEYDEEIFDDDDFYHQLLRELIEYKSMNESDPVKLSRQWITLQSMRSKMKKKVDKKASKGRKIRYAVHPKLVNFMAPIDESKWTEQSKNELFNSLFGAKITKSVVI